MNEIGVANFLDLEEKLNCKFIISTYATKIKVLAKKEDLPQIQKEVEAKLSHHFFYRFSLVSKVYKYYQEHPELLENLQKEFELTLMELEEDNWALLLEGSALNIQNAVTWVHEKGKGRSDQKGRNLNDCGICGAALEESYRLYCKHPFCRECLLDYLHYSFSDMSQFPLLCP
jgi:hypothetical protein